jgi:hypothetical protein
MGGGAGGEGGKGGGVKVVNHFSLAHRITARTPSTVKTITSGFIRYLKYILVLIYS